MDGFLKEYAGHLRDLSRMSHAGQLESVEAALNGEAQIELEKGSHLYLRRKQGAFFTGHSLRQILLKDCTYRDAPFYDPTCGAGDLLLEAAQKLPIEKSLDKTIDTWGQVIWGTDIDVSFVKCAKLRLYLLARQRHGQILGGSIPKKLFPNIKKGDASKSNRFYRNAKTIILNPPFGKLKASENYELSQGATHRAGVFTYYSVTRMRTKSRILAILPDALRAGTFSSHWRSHIEQYLQVRKLEPYGVFDNSADINVFLIDARKKECPVWAPIAWFDGYNDGTHKVGKHFAVSVGSIVPYRHVSGGESYSYLYPKNTPVWGEVKEVSDSIRTKTRVVKGPFVVIRRTSRVEQPYRASGTLIRGRGYFAVENHLLVCKPLDGTLKTCKKLMKILRTDNTNNILNDRICCRHLTVPSIEDLPFDYHVC